MDPVEKHYWPVFEALVIAREALAARPENEAPALHRIGMAWISPHSGAVYEFEADNDIGERLGLDYVVVYAPIKNRKSQAAGVRPASQDTGLCP